MSSLLIITLILISNCVPAKIAGIFPFPSKSHWILGSALLKELARRGHEVTMISPFPLENPPERYADVNLRGLTGIHSDIISDMLKGNQSTLRRAITMVLLAAEITRDICGNKDLHAFIKEGNKFDLVIQLTVLLNEAVLAVGHALNATTIGFGVGGITPYQNYFTGIPAPYAYVPHLATPFTDEMNFTQRVLNTLMNIITDLFCYFVALPYQQSLLKEYFPKAPPLQELIDNLDLTLLNSHVTTETPRPYLPNTIQIGGYYLETETEKLPRDVEEFLNTSKHGVIYFSLGSSFKSSFLPHQILTNILEAFKNTKYDVLWVHDGNLSGKTENVMLTKWAPQRAVLAHDNVKLFITHAGLGSTVEAVYYGKPMICIPLLLDQFKNAADSVAKGYALIINKDEITKDLLVRTINEIIDNPRYREVIGLTSDIYRNQEMNPMDKAVFWVEHVLKHKGAKHLKAKAAYLPLYQYYLLDVFAFIIFVLLTTVLFLYYCLRFLFRLRVCKSKKLKTN